MNNIYLIGMMGVGKSTIGKLLATKLNYKFIDGDDYIIENSKFNSINEIFECNSEEYFRNIESEKLQDLSLNDECVIATGGGIILKKDNILIMKKTGIIIYLKSNIESLANNLYNTESRPLLKNIDLHSKLNEIFEKRKEIYDEVSDEDIYVNFKSKKEIVDLIINTIKR